MISLDEFLSLSAQEVTKLVHDAGPQVCVFPINGTRRWYVIEDANEHEVGDVEGYINKLSQVHVDLFRLCFDQGIETLLAPAFGSDLLLRNDYMGKIGAKGLELLAEGSIFTDFYFKYDVRVHFYGDYRHQLSDTPYEYLVDLFGKTEERTKGHNRYRLFYGVFANNSTDYIARYAVQYFKEHGVTPDQKAIVGGFYGEYVEPVSFFIGFDKPTVFDYPLLSSGEEDLYFTLAPSPDLDIDLLRRILYDHLYTRRIPEPDYETLGDSDKKWIKNFYRLNRGAAFGLGLIHGGLWFPDPDQGLPQT